MTRLFKILGFEEAITTCDCCGKAHLKGTFGIEMIESGEILYYGSVCVTRNTGYTKKEINAMAKADEAERVKIARAEYLATPEYAAARARNQEAHALKIVPGSAFKAFVLETADADRAVQKAIAAKYKVATYQL